MVSRRPWYLLLAVVAGCQDQIPVSPTTEAPPGPLLLISDGAHNGNPDFFFRPPMVSDPSSDPDFTPGGFNPNLSPTVQVCALAVANNAPESAVTASTPCKSSGYSVTFSGGQIALNLVDQQYQVDWMVPNAPETYYRIFVRVGATQLGSADVKAAKNGNANNFVIRKDGTQLPIKFRIEQFALCDEPGVGPCSSETVDRSTGGEVVFSSGGETIGGIIIPAQGGGNNPVHVTIDFCQEEGPAIQQANLPIDLPVFGACLRVQTDPAIEGDNALTVPGEVYICELGGIEGLSEAQEQQVTIHRYDGEEVQALPHTPGNCPPVIGAAPSWKGLARALAARHWKRAGAELLGLLAPRPLHASAAMLDVGRGGATFVFSDFQNALPAKMEIESGNNQVGVFGEELPAPAVVKVTDIFDQPVANARVHFSTSDGSVTPLTVLTGSDGLAQATWTLPEAAEGSLTLSASGHGLATPDNNGPRDDCTVECEGGPFWDPFLPAPFLPFDGPPEGDPPPSPVTLETGTLTFTATGVDALLRISGFHEGRNRAPLVNTGGVAPTGPLGSSRIVSALQDGSQFGPSGTVACPAQLLPFVQTIETGSLVNGGGRLVDVFFAGLTATALTSAEAAELAAFLNAGGVVYISGNSNPTEGSSYHPLFAALGIEDLYDALNTVAVNGQSSDPPDTTPFTNGPFGVVGPLSHSIFRPILTSTLLSLATGASSEATILAEGAFGSGRLSVMGDPMYMNQFTDVTGFPSSGDADNLTYFLNLFALGCPGPEIE
jgi:hypothetical protein